MESSVRLPHGSTRSRHRFPLQRMRCWLLTLGLVLGWTALCAFAQQDQPLSGNRLAYLEENIYNTTYAALRWYGVDVTAPEADNVPASEVEFNDMEVYVSAFVERLFDVNVDRYTHDVGMRIMMSWNDPSFPLLVNKATSRWKETGECERFCGLISTECCDEVFLPGGLLINVDELPDGRTFVEEFVQIGALGDVYTGVQDGSVLWATNVHGIFHSDFNFGSFPNDRQQLRIVFKAEGCGYIFKESATGKSFTWDGNRPQKNSKRAVGDDTSGWEIENVEVKVWYAPYTNLYVKSRVNDPSDPFFGPTGFLEDYSTEKIISDYELCEQNYKNLDVCGVRCSHGFTITLTVKRYSTYFGWNTIFPVAVIVICSLLTYFIDPKMIELRLSSIIALILALTALQFVIQEFLPDSSYLTPVAQMIVCGYWIMLIEAIETVFVFWMVEYKAIYLEHMREKERSERELLADQTAFEDVEGTMRQAQSEVRRRTSQPTHMESFEGDDGGVDHDEHDDPEDVLHRYRLKQFGKSSSNASYYAEADDPGIRKRGDMHADAEEEKEESMHRSSSSSLTNVLAKSTRVFTSMNRHRAAFLSQKTEYKVALIVDLVFLILSAVGFTIATILFFVLDNSS